MSGFDGIDRSHGERLIVSPALHLQLWTYDVARNLAALRRAKRLNLFAWRSFRVRRGAA